MLGESSSENELRVSAGLVATIGVNITIGALYDIGNFERNRLRLAFPRGVQHMAIPPAGDAP